MPSIAGPPLDGGTELGALLAGVLSAVADAQDVVDADAQRRTAAFFESPAGALVPPPLWYTYRSVSVELELAPSVSTVDRGEVGREARAQLLCRTLNPTSVGLFGHRAASGLRVRLLADVMAPPAPRPER